MNGYCAVNVIKSQWRQQHGPVGRLFFFFNRQNRRRPLIPLFSPLSLFHMLAATTRRAFASLSNNAKAYSTAAATTQISTAQNGIKVASIEEPGQAAGLSVVINGGSRLENSSGVAHFLKNYGFKVRNYNDTTRTTQHTSLNISTYIQPL